MKRVIVVCFLTITALTIEAHDRFSHKRIKIDHKIIDSVDGTPRINIIKILTLEEGILKMQEGENSHGLFSYEGKKLTTKQLVEIEKKIKKSKTLKDSLYEAIAHFEKITHSYLNEARGFKSQMCALIKKWADQRKVKSILVEWGNQSSGQELEQLKKLASTFEEFDALLDDLSCFLKDMRYSCRKSWNTFIKNQKK